MDHMFYAAAPNHPYSWAIKRSWESEAAFDFAHMGCEVLVIGPCQYHRLREFSDFAIGRALPGWWLSTILLAVLVQATLVLSARFAKVAGDASLREKLRRIIERRQRKYDRFNRQAATVETLKAQVDQLEQTLDEVPDHRERSANDGPTGDMTRNGRLLRYSLE
jgi:hypothetical protein